MKKETIMNNIQKFEFLWILQLIDCIELQFIARYNQTRILNSCLENVGIFILGEEVFLV